MIVINDESPVKIATEQNLMQTHDEDAFMSFAEKIIDANPKVVADYKAGKEAALMSLVGQVMKETKGSANPVLVRRILVELLK